MVACELSCDSDRNTDNGSIAGVDELDEVVDTDELDDDIGAGVCGDIADADVSEVVGDGTDECGDVNELKPQ